MDHTGYKQKHQPSHWQRHVWFGLIFIQVSRGELAGPLSNSVQVKYRIRSDDVQVLGVHFSLVEILSNPNWGSDKATVFHTAANKIYCSLPTSCFQVLKSLT